MKRLERSTAQGLLTRVNLINHQYVRIMFDNKTDEFFQFRENYLAFYREFNWAAWDPGSNPCPAHNSLLGLQGQHTMKKDDPYLLSWGFIMAVLNGSKFNKALTELNSYDKRVNYVFQSGTKNTKSLIFFSVDTENGTLEIYDHTGKHLSKIYGLKIGLREQKRNYTIHVPQSKWLE